MTLNELAKLCEDNEYVGTLHIRLDKVGGKNLWRGVIVPDSPLDSLGHYPCVKAQGSLDTVVKKLYKKLTP